jgi:hypothetical protein
VIDFGEWSPNPTHEFTVLTIDTKKKKKKEHNFQPKLTRGNKVEIPQI